MCRPTASPARRPPAPGRLRARPVTTCQVVPTSGLRSTRPVDVVSPQQAVGVEGERSVRTCGNRHLDRLPRDATVQRARVGALRGADQPLRVLVVDGDRAAANARPRPRLVDRPEHRAVVTECEQQRGRPRKGDHAPGAGRQLPPHPVRSAILGHEQRTRVGRIERLRGEIPPRVRRRIGERRPGQPVRRARRPRGGDRSRAGASSTTTTQPVAQRLKSAPWSDRTYEPQRTRISTASALLRCRPCASDAASSARRSLPSLTWFRPRRLAA